MGYLSTCRLYVIHGGAYCAPTPSELELVGEELRCASQYSSKFLGYGEEALLKSWSKSIGYPVVADCEDEYGARFMCYADGMIGVYSKLKAKTVITWPTTNLPGWNPNKCPTAMESIEYD